MTLRLAVDNTTPATVAEQRRALLGKVHIARKALAIVEEDYRALLTRVTGHNSAKDCDNRQLGRMMVEFERMGFRATGAGARRAPAGSPIVRKARAMWISLHQLGAIDDPAESALEAFGRRQLGVERLQWADERQGFRMIEALKAVADRHGWDQSVSSRLPTPERIRILKDRLIGAQLARLATAGIEVADALRADRAEWSNKRLESAASELAIHIHNIPV